MSQDTSEDINTDSTTTSNEPLQFQNEYTQAFAANDNDDRVVQMWDIIPENTDNDEAENGNNNNEDETPLLGNSNNNTNSAFYDRAVVYLSSLFDATAFIVISLLILRVFRFLFDISTFSNDASMDIRNYVNLPANILLNNNLTLLYDGAAESDPKLNNPYSMSRFSDCFFNSLQLHGYPQYSFFKPFNLTCILTYNTSSDESTNYTTKDNSTLEIMRTAAELSKYSFRLVSVIRTTNVSSLDKAATNSTDALHNQLGFIVLNSLLFKMSNALVHNVPWFCNNVPTFVLRTFAILVYFVYGALGSFYLFSCFVFFSISLYYLIAKKFLDMSNYLAKLLESDSTGIF